MLTAAQRVGGPYRPGPDRRIETGDAPDGYGNDTAAPHYECRHRRRPPVHLADRTQAAIYALREGLVPPEV